MTINNSEIKAIIFDFIGVLLFKKENYIEEELTDNIDSTVGRIVDDQKWQTEVMKKYDLKEEELFLILNKIVNKYEGFESLWNILPALNKKYRLAIINNGTALTIPSFKSRYPIDQYFDLFVSSAIEGVKKPDEKIFLLTISKLKVQPKECLFMDDYRDNVEAAKKLGMQTIWWKDKESGFELFQKFLNKSS